mgnify:FL=1
MKEITMPKREIAKILNKVEVSGIDISKYQKKPKTFTKLPAIAYKQIGDNIKRQFGKMIILKETFGFEISVFGNKSSEVSSIVQEIKKQMLLAGYRYLAGGDDEDETVNFKFTMVYERSV